MTHTAHNIADRQAAGAWMMDEGLGETGRWTEVSPSDFGKLEKR